MKHFISYVLLIAGMLLAGCEEDEYVYPSALTEILSAGTDSTGSINYLLTDKGVSYHIENGDSYSGLVSDTVYRMLAVYDVNTAELSAHVYSLRQVVAPEPLSDWTGEIKQDPVDVQSIWLSGGYLNMVLLVKAQNKKHVFHFIEMENSSVLKLKLYHYKGEDVEAYTQRAYLSVPLRKYETYCNEIHFTLNTVEEGLRTYTFDMQ